MVIIPNESIQPADADDAAPLKDRVIRSVVASVSLPADCATKVPVTVVPPATNRQVVEVDEISGIRRMIDGSCKNAIIGPPPVQRDAGICCFAGNVDEMSIV